MGFQLRYKTVSITTRFSTFGRSDSGEKRLKLPVETWNTGYNDQAISKKVQTA